MASIGRPQLVVPVHLPAPLGGVNRVAPATLLPEMDALLLSNMIASENGLRPRPGYREWAIGLGAEIRSIFPYTGASTGSDRLYCATKDGLYDVTESGDGPWTPDLAFSNTGAEAGYGTMLPFITTADRFAVYCDEVNGYFVRAENGTGWRPVVQKGTLGWQADHAYALGDKIVETVDTVEVTFICTQAGTSHASTEPTWAVEDEIDDGGVKWSYRQHVYHETLSPDPAHFAQVCSFKERLLFVERESTRVWVPKIAGALSGELVEIELGRSFKTGGKLAGLYVWTMDGAQGTDDLLVAVSTAGDVVWFEGTDPTAAADSASRMKRVGTAFVGGVPLGRRLAFAYGGDLLLITTIGLLPMSSLVAGKQLLAPDTYSTYKIRPMFTREMTDRRNMRGWALLPHPDGHFMLQIPSRTGEISRQLAMSMSTKGWSAFSGLPITHGAVWLGRLYFGTADGRVCANDVDSDNMPLDGTVPNAEDLAGHTGAAVNVNRPIAWSGLSRYSDFGAPARKQVRLLRPIFLVQGAAPTCKATARYDLDMSGIKTPAGVADPTTGWDVAEWATGESDTNAKAGVWSEGGTVDTTGFSRVTGCFGMGRHVAVAWAGASRSPVSLVGFDLTVERGGVL